MKLSDTLAVHKIFHLLIDKTQGVPASTADDEQGVLESCRCNADMHVQPNRRVLIILSKLDAECRSKLGTERLVPEHVRGKGETDSGHECSQGFRKGKLQAQLYPGRDH